MPKIAASVLGMKGSVYSHLAKRLHEQGGPVYPLHIGDTWMEPAEGCRMQDLEVSDHPGMHRYAGVQGVPELIEAVGARVSARTGVATGFDDVLIAAGATGGLCGLVGAIVEPGDEVVILAPFWPLIAGMVRAFGGVAVPVPFIGVADSPETAVEVVRAALTDRTVALYWNTPNNPTGRRIPAPWLAALAELARERDLWVVSDEVYEEYVYAGEHVYSRAFAPERVVSCHSFSKSYGMAGNRAGYLVGPADILGHAKKITTHTFYSTPTASQLAALAALGPAGDAWVAQARAKYAELGRWAAERLGVEAPEGSTFLFLDVSDHLDETGLVGLLERAVERGLLVAPGDSFGPYPNHVRLCFTSAAPERVRAGVEVLASLLGR
ncbi:MAG: pyridoxal phosphate-dependent aminotransferase [Alphaproteobacteria bacterium]|nr:pyridoxal phosphate-dependent aminotransferase [Alphaproteobacteria bacterium]